MANSQGIPPIIDKNTQGAISGEGSFTIGTSAIFIVSFSDIDGQLFDPSDINISILDPSNTDVDTIAGADQLQLGRYMFTWQIPNDATSGKYTANIEYVVETSSGPVTRSFYEYFIVSESGQGALNYRTVALRGFLDHLLDYVQRIPVYHEPARLNNARTIAELTFPRWNQTAGVKVWINGDLKESGYTPDYLKGRILFDKSLSSYDNVMVSYNFRWFTDDALDDFVEQGVNIFNIWPPQSAYTTTTLPDRFTLIAEYGGAVNAIRSLLMSLITQEPAKVFGGPTRVNEIMAHLRELKKNYEEWLEKMLTQKKYGPYTGLFRTITASEMTTPGGKSRWVRLLFSGNVS